MFYADEGEVLLAEGITRQQAQLLADHDLTQAEKILGECQRLDLTLLTIQDAAYPGRLKNIYDPPCLLYVKGRLPAFDEELAVAVVGTRACTPYGIACGEKLGYGLTAGGALVVSGLAAGVDAAATRGALRAGGSTAAVAACGLDVRYPYENRYLYEDVAAARRAFERVPARNAAAEGEFPRAQPHPLRPGPGDACGGGAGAQRRAYHRRHGLGTGTGRIRGAPAPLTRRRAWAATS